MTRPHYLKSRNVASDPPKFAFQQPLKAKKISFRWTSTEFEPFRPSRSLAVFVHVLLQVILQAGLFNPGLLSFYPVNVLFRVY